MSLIKKCKKYNRPLRVYNFIALNYWIIIKILHEIVTFLIFINFKIFITLPIIYSRISSIIVFEYKIFYWFFPVALKLIVFLFLLWTKTFFRQICINSLHEIIVINVSDSFIFVIILNIFEFFVLNIYSTWPTIKSITPSITSS